MTRTHAWVKQAGILTLGVVVAAVMVWLGLWQLDVYRAQGDAAAQRRVDRPPVALTAIAPAGQAVLDGYGRSVEITGHYVPGLQVLVPSPGGFRVLTGLRQADGSIVGVVRGLVATPPAPRPAGGPVARTGVLLPSEETTDPSVTTTPGQLPAVRLPALAQSWPGPLVNGFVTLDAAGAAAEGLTAAPVALPESKGRLRNAAYALQWWVFAAFAVGMSIRVARDVGRAEERSEDEAFA